MKFRQYLYLNEVAYKGNIGFEEMVRFMDVADESQIKKMENLIKKANWKGFKKLIEKVLGVILK